MSQPPKTPSAPKTDTAFFDMCFAQVLGHLAAAEWAEGRYGNHEMVAAHAARFAHAATEARTKPFSRVVYADGVKLPTPAPQPAPSPEPEPIAEIPAGQPIPPAPPAPPAEKVDEPIKAATQAEQLAKIKEIADLANR